VPIVAVHWTPGGHAVDPARLAAFWALALGYVDEPGYDDPAGASIVDPEGKGPAVGFLRIPAGKSAKNRIRVAGEGLWDMAERERLIRAKVAELGRPWRWSSRSSRRPLTVPGRQVRGGPRRGRLPVRSTG
jgi:hypothetical protein